MATNPVLYVFDGMAVVLEKELPGGKYKIRKSELKMKGDGSRYTCVVYEVCVRVCVCARVCVCVCARVCGIHDVIR
jgi:hypothetical protein